MVPISGDNFQLRTEGAEVLERDRMSQASVLRTDDGLVYKLLRYENPSAHPYAITFQRNAERLAELGVPTVAVQSVLRVAELRTDIVVYPFVHGQTLREQMAQPSADTALILRLMDFVADLHRMGVYFRALHLRNILLLPDGAFGLIDVGALAFRRSGLSAYYRARNFRILVKYPEDLAALSTPGLPNTVRRYLDRARISTLRAKAFLTVLRCYRPDLARSLAQV
jgi:hypothetical protein